MGRNSNLVVKFYILCVILTGCLWVSVASINENVEIVSINKTANISEAHVGDVIEYTIVIKNTGDEALHVVEVDDILPYGIRYINGSESIVCTGGAVPKVKEKVRQGTRVGLKIPARPGAKRGAKIGAKIGPKVKAEIGLCYHETRYEVYIKPALLNKRLTEIYQESMLLDEKIVEIYQTPLIWNESNISLFSIYGDIMFPEYLPLYTINNMTPYEVCIITYKAKVILCHANATNHANLIVKNSYNKSLLNISASAVVNIPCPPPDFTITNMSIPTIKEIKNVTIPYGTGKRNETLVFSAMVFLNKTRIGDKKIIYFDVENLKHLPYINFDNVNITFYENGKYYDSLTRNFTNIAKITNISFNWTPTTHGWHNITMVVDPNNEIQELNETNNNLTLEIEVVLPDIIITNISIPIREEIKDVIIPYGSNIRNEFSSVSRQLIINKTPLGERRIIYFDIRNFEEPPFPYLGEVNITLYENNNYYASIIKNLTNAYEYYNIGIEWIPMTAGLHNLTIVIDPNNEIQESNESNNNLTLEIEVVLPDLAVTNISMPIIKEVKRIMLPYNHSLRIFSEFIFTNTTTINQKRIIYANVKNFAKMPFSYLNNVSISLYDNHNYYTSRRLNLSNVYEFLNLDFDWNPQSLGIHNLTCAIDPNNEISESNEYNNNMSFVVEVLPIPTPDFTITNISAMKISEKCHVYSSLFACKNVSIKVDIKNLAEPPYLEIGDVDISLLIFNKYGNIVYNVTEIRNFENVWMIKNLNFEWKPQMPGLYNIAVIIDKHNKINETSESNNNITIFVEIDNCTMPVDDLYINSNTTFYRGIYNIHDERNNGVIIINSSNIFLDCNGATLSGAYTGYGIYNPGFDNVTIKNCKISKYSHGIFINNSNSTEILDNEILNNEVGIFSQNSNLTINNNVVCGNKLSDFDSSGWFLSSGDDNICDKAGWWNDTSMKKEGKRGCRISCAQQMEMHTYFDIDKDNVINVFDVVAGLEKLSYGDAKINLVDLLILSEKIAHMVAHSEPSFL